MKDKYYRCSYKLARPKNINTLLPKILQNIEKNYKRNPSIVIHYFIEIIGSKLVPMVKVKSFENKVMVVIVTNSTLFSLLNNYEKDNLLKKMQAKFSEENIKKIIFKIG